MIIRYYEIVGFIRRDGESCSFGECTVVLCKEAGPKGHTCPMARQGFEPFCFEWKIGDSFRETITLQKV